MHNPIYGRFYSYNKGFGILYLGLDCKFVIVFFAPTAKCCYMNNIEPSSILTFTSLFFWGGFYHWKVVLRQFYSPG